jgi:hypothetical protein
MPRGTGGLANFGGKIARGRTKGVPNKVTTTIREALAYAHDRAGGWRFWLALAQGGSEDRRCFAQCVSRLIPLEIQGSLDAKLTVTINKIMTLASDDSIIETMESPLLKSQAATVPLRESAGSLADHAVSIVKAAALAEGTSSDT